MTLYYYHRIWYRIQNIIKILILFPSKLKCISSFVKGFQKEGRKYFARHNIFSSVSKIVLLMMWSRSLSLTLEALCERCMMLAILVQSSHHNGLVLPVFMYSQCFLLRCNEVVMMDYDHFDSSQGIKSHVLVLILILFHGDASSSFLHKYGQPVAALLNYIFREFEFK